MISAAEAAYPNECCGLVAGIKINDETHEISRVIESRNVHPSGGHDRFEIDPKVRFDLMRALGEIGDEPPTSERLIGHYHSHPDRPATPSIYDLTCVFEPELLWIILGLKQGFVRRVSVFQFDLENQNFNQLPLRQADGSSYAIAPDFD